MNETLISKIVNQEFDELLGSGSFSDVYKLTDPTTLCVYAIKKVNSEDQMRGIAVTNSPKRQK